MNKIKGNTIKEFNGLTDNTTIVEETEKGINGYLVDYLVVCIQGNQVEKIKLGNKRYSIDFVYANDSMNRLHIDIGKDKKKGSYTFKW